MGEVILDIRLGNEIIPTRFTVSNNVAEPMLGSDWLRKNDITWYFCIDSVTYRLQDDTLPSYSYLGVLCLPRRFVAESITNADTRFHSFTQTPTSFPEVDKTGKNI